ncbi:MAG: molybdenum cofactor guanylyltransferase [Chloroflexi bacterium]|nr:molybdenum cofactor guanylyltransferase [Chloroflexota bacterium]
MQPEISAVVLAGGRGERLGMDKADVVLGGKTLLLRSLSLLAPLTDDPVVVLRPGQSLHGGPPPARVVRDLAPYAGVLAGMAAGLQACRHDWAIVVACDMPFLNADLLAHMISLRDEHDIVVPRLTVGLEPLHALYHRRTLPAIRRAMDAGRRRLVSFYEGLDVRYVDEPTLLRLDPELRSLFNVNTPPDLALAEEWLAAAPPRA